MTMKTYCQKIILLFLITSLLACSTEDEIVTPLESEGAIPDEIALDSEALEARFFKDVSYGNHPEQIYDLYLPEGRKATNTKVIVLVHGGGWQSGDKNNMSQYVNYFLENHPKYAILNLNYTLAVLDSVYAFPNQYLDIDAALQQISDRSELHQILPKFGMLGTSAGAHLAMMYDYVYDTTNQVAFVTNIVGPSDFTDPFFTQQQGFDENVAGLVDESQYPPGSDLIFLNSPVHNVTSLSSPTLLFYGNQDPLVPLSNGVSLANSLNAWGIDNNFTIYDGGHGGDWSEADRANMFNKIDNYISVYLSMD